LLERIGRRDLAAVRATVQAEFDRMSAGRIAVVAPHTWQDGLDAELTGFARSDDFLDPAATATVGLSVLTARESKGLEFDVVIVVEPAEIVGESSQGINDLYVAVTRPTQRLIVLYSSTLPAGMTGTSS
jgi:ATP-dependent exoDNAse (exonuclease V) beta subunit